MWHQHKKYYTHRYWKDTPPMDRNAILTNEGYMKQLEEAWEASCRAASEGHISDPQFDCVDFNARKFHCGLWPERTECKKGDLGWADLCLTIVNPETDVGHMCYNIQNEMP